MGNQSIIIKKLHEQGKRDPLAYVREVAKTRNIAELGKFLNVSYYTIWGFITRHGIEVSEYASKLYKTNGGRTVAMLTRDCQKMTQEELAKKYKVHIRTMNRVLRFYKLKAIRKQADKNKAEIQTTFFCLDCKLPQPLALLSPKKETCQRCLKNQIRSRV